MKAAAKAILAIVMIAIFAFVTTGCDQKEPAQSNASQAPASANDRLDQKAADSNLSDVKPVENSQAKHKIATGDIAKPATVTVYFSDDQGENLVVETRTVNTITSNLPKAAIEQLIKGPSSKTLVETIPDGTRLLNLDVIKGTAYANFSKELSEKHWGGSTMELLTVRSIVNTLTNFDEIKNVQIMIDGKKVETIAGHVDISKPLTRESLADAQQ